MRAFRDSLLIMENLKSAKRVARVKLTLTKRTVDALEPEDKAWIAWDDRLVGFGCRVQPSGTKSFIVNYRSGDGGRNAPNRRVVIGRHGRVGPDEARRKARDMLGQVARGEDPAGERAEARGVPTLAEAFETYVKANPNRAEKTERLYRQVLRGKLGDWTRRPLDAITRQDVEDRFNRITARHGWATGNQAMSLLRSVYRRPCADHGGLRNPVDLWLAAGQWHSDKFFWRSDKKAPALRAVAGSRGPCLLAGFGVRRVPGSATCSLAVSTAVHSCARAFRAGCTATGRT